VRDLDGGRRSLAKTEFGLGSNMVGDNQCHEDHNRNDCPVLLGQVGSLGMVPEPPYYVTMFTRLLWTSSMVILNITCLFDVLYKVIFLPSLCALAGFLTGTYQSYLISQLRITSRQY